jgi:hypothetical protein
MVANRLLDVSSPVHVPGHFNRGVSAEMTQEEQQLMYELCQKIAVEKDLETFNQLCLELNVLLEKKEFRLNPKREIKPKS